MIMINKVNSIEEARICDGLLTKLIQSESKFNNNINSAYIIREYFEKIYSNIRNALFVAKDDNDIIGYVYCKCITSKESPEIFDEALIDGLYVEEKYRMQGIATNLLNEAKKWCKSKKIKYININVLENNIKAMKLYKALGYNDFEKKLKLKI